MWYGIALAGVAAAVIFALNAVYGFVGGASSTTGSQRTVTVARGTVQSSVTASGNVDVARSATANFSTSGTVTSVKVKVGDVVKVGQTLATLDSSSAEADLETAKANLAQAKATLASAAERRHRRAAGVERFEPAPGAGPGDEREAAAGGRPEGARHGAAAARRQQEARLSACVELVGRFVAVELLVEPAERCVQSVFADIGLGGDELDQLELIRHLHAQRIVDRAHLDAGWERSGRRERRLRILRVGRRGSRRGLLDDHAVIADGHVRHDRPRGERVSEHHVRPRPDLRLGRHDGRHSDRRLGDDHHRDRDHRGLGDDRHLGDDRPGGRDRSDHRHPERDRQPGGARHDRPLRLRHVLHEPVVVDAGSRYRLGLERGSRHGGVEGPEAEPELLVPGRRDELVRHDQRRARPVHDR